MDCRSAAGLVDEALAPAADAHARSTADPDAAAHPDAYAACPRNWSSRRRPARSPGCTTAFRYARRSRARPGGRRAWSGKPPPATRWTCNLRSRCRSPRARRKKSRTAHPRCSASCPSSGRCSEGPRYRGFFYGIYQNKTELLRQNLTHLDALLPRDTFYDTDTILEIQDPDTRRKMLLIQSDMDVDSDGSDPGTGSTRSTPATTRRSSR